MRVDEAIALATRFHEGSTDKAGQPYIAHPRRVMAAMTTDDEKLTAVLHDVLDRTTLTERDLVAAGCPASVLDALDALTHRPDESYYDYVLMASLDPIAHVVKLAEIVDNLDPCRLAQLDGAEASRLRAKYEPAFDALLELPPADATPSLYSVGEPAVAGDDEIVVNFNCDTCGHPAGRVVLYPDSAPDAHIRRVALVATGVEGRISFAIPHEKAAVLTTAVTAGDVQALHFLNAEYTPFWCWKCQLSYCHRHWRLEVLMDDGFYDACYGTCPHGHRVMLGD